MSDELISPGLLTLRATPAHGCAVCSYLAERFRRTRERDLLLEINNHPHERPKLELVRRIRGTVRE